MVSRAIAASATCCFIATWLIGCGGNGDPDAGTKTMPEPTPPPRVTVPTVTPTSPPPGQAPITPQPTPQKTHEPVCQCDNDAQGVFHQADGKCYLEGQVCDEKAPLEACMCSDGKKGALATGGFCLFSGEDCGKAEGSTGQLTCSCVGGTNGVLTTDGYCLLNGKACETSPEWLQPLAESCQTQLGETAGSSDMGEFPHECVSCDEKCGQLNKQKTVYTSWVFSPALDQNNNIFDMKEKIEFTDFRRLQAWGSNGIYQAMRFFISKGDHQIAFSGYAGPQITGGGGAGKALRGTHLFSVWDTKKPDTSGAPVSGRRLAIPAADPGSCTRNCNDCGLHPELAASHTTGTKCAVTHEPATTGSSFVYRLRMSNGEATATFAGTEYKGTEWEVTVQDLATHQNIVVGRVLFAEDVPSQGIATFKNFHEHIGCTPCDAFYERTTVTGPFVLKPEGMYVVSGSVEPPTAEKYTCRLFRTTHTNGLEVVLESGPGVTPAENANFNNALLYDQCAYSSTENKKKRKKNKNKNKNKNNSNSYSNSSNSLFAQTIEQLPFATSTTTAMSPTLLLLGVSTLLLAVVAGRIARQIRNSAAEGAAHEPLLA